VRDGIYHRDTENTEKAFGFPPCLFASVVNIESFAGR